MEKTKDIKRSVRAGGAALVEKLKKLEQVLEQGKAVEPVLVEMEGRGAFTEALFVAGATSRRHAQGLADAINRLCGENGYEFLGMEGYEGAEWILVDCNDVVINIFQEDTRQLYKLEELWSAARRVHQKEILP